ncbi:ABC transporter permease [Marivirga sp. S37H4]|uniref:ABC transporter permease n=1 Tax=Marivirga aurantiaca TaxID=2802615 RepID=A0A934X0S5_9BACT|nr:ABC transporter permease [Marivirga aurantiaca]MBK6266362.1 ABC transporter permease [Marivirga aurantiaca]
MLKNYIKIAWRNLLKNKVYSFINISGLGIGIACCFMIFMYVQDELSYDQYHEKKDRIYRVLHGFNESSESDNVKPDYYEVWGNAPVGQALASDFQEIEKVVQFSGRADILLRNGEKMFQEDGIFFMDSTVFDVFSWKLIKGDPQKALVAPYSIVLTETTAKKYFGDEDPMGKTLDGDPSGGRSNKGIYTVTGVMEDVPENSHFKFNTLLSMSTFYQSRPGVFDQWGYVDFYTYFLVNDQFNPEDFEQRIPDFLERRVGDTRPGYTISIESLNDTYLGSTALRQPGELGSMSNIYIFSIIGLFILVIAIINFMNLSTARSMERGKEVGIRKTIGADRKGLIFQFLGESLIIVVIASVLASILVTIMLPFMADLTAKSFDISMFISWGMFPVFLGIILLIGLIAGSYPSFVLSSFKPAAILKGTSLKEVGGVSLRKGLVIFQFTLSIILISGTIIVYTQMEHILEKNLGFDQERMLVLDYNYDVEVNKKLDNLKNEMEAIPSVLSMAAARSVPGSYFPKAGTTIETESGELREEIQPIFQVDVDFIPQMGLELVEGRGYSRDFPSDLDNALVVNESAARQYGYSNPADIVGKKFSQWGKEGQVIGVVKDFNYESLHKKIEPLTLMLERFASRFIILKVNSDDLPATIASVESVWESIAPHRPFLYSFLDDDFNKQYIADFRFKKLFTVFSILAILISCLGLLGLATYTAETRTKEIGIRKVLGAGVSNIVGLLSKDFIKLVLVAIVIATPISWHAMNLWLEDFAFRVNVNWWTYATAGLLAIIVALLTISFQSIKAALMNPVKSLKNE